MGGVSMKDSKGKRRDHCSIPGNVIIFPTMHVFTVFEINELFDHEDNKYKIPHNLKLVSR